LFFVVKKIILYPGKNNIKLYFDELFKKLNG